MCATLPKIFRPVTRNTHIFIYLTHVSTKMYEPAQEILVLIACSFTQGRFMSIVRSVDPLIAEYSHSNS